MITRASEDEEYKEVRGRPGYLLVQMLASRYSNDCNVFFSKITRSLGDGGGRYYALVQHSDGIRYVIDNISME